MTFSSNKTPFLILFDSCMGFSVFLSPCSEFEGSREENMDLVNWDAKILIDGKHLECRTQLTEDEFLYAFEYLGRIQQKGMVYVGDLAVEAEKQGYIKHGNNSEFYTRASEKSNLTRKTIQDAKYIMERIESSNRFEDCGILHYKYICTLSNEQQKYFLEKCINEKWSTKKLKNKDKYYLHQMKNTKNKTNGRIVKINTIKNEIGFIKELNDKNVFILKINRGQGN